MLDSMLLRRRDRVVVAAFMVANAHDRRGRDDDPEATTRALGTGEKENDLILITREQDFDVYAEVAKLMILGT